MTPIFTERMQLLHALTSEISLDSSHSSIDNFIVVNFPFLFQGSFLILQSADLFRVLVIIPRCIQSSENSETGACCSRIWVEIQFKSASFPSPTATPASSLWIFVSTRDYGQFSSQLPFQHKAQLFFPARPPIRPPAFLTSFGFNIHLRYSPTMRKTNLVEKYLLIVEKAFGCTKDGDELHRTSTFTTRLVVEYSRVFRIPCCLNSSRCKNYSLRCGDFLPFRWMFT